MSAASACIRARPHGRSRQERQAVGVERPYAEVEEQLGGYYLIEAPDLDGAIVWAARCPGADTGAIEVRPIWAM
jgi:hypothetical protein